MNVCQEQRSPQDEVSAAVKAYMEAPTPQNLSRSEHAVYHLAAYYKRVWQARLAKIMERVA